MIRSRRFAATLTICTLAGSFLALGSTAQGSSFSSSGSSVRAATTPSTVTPTGTSSQQTATATADPGTPSSTASPGLDGSPSAPAVTTTAKPSTLTDTEFLNVQIDANGDPIDVNVKEWYRVRGSKSKITFDDPGVLKDVHATSGTSPHVGDHSMSMRLAIPSSGFADAYITGKPIPGEGNTFKTASGPQRLPITLKIRYYTGDPGSDEATKQVNASEFSHHHGPFKLVISLVNNTKHTEEVQYNDVQTKKAMTGIADVSTPYSVKISGLEFPDGRYDGLTTNGVVGRHGKASTIDWQIYLAPPDYPNEQNAIVQGRSNGPEIPKINVVAQPVYPEPVAEALSSSGQQFQKGRRTFYLDVLNLFRENLIALGGLFSTLDDSFSNLALPLIGPEKGNRDSGTFTHANLLWGTWTIAKGTEQLSRAMVDLTYSVQLARDGLKGEIGTLQLLRSFIGKSTDKPVLNGPPTCLPVCTQAQVTAQVNQLLSESMWANIKDLEISLGAPTASNVPGGPNDPRPYLPEAPASLATNGAVAISVLKIKLAILEHNFYCIVYEDHTNECSSILGISNKPGATGWDKYLFVKFPFGQLELEKGLRAIEDEGTNQITQALGNKVQTNSFVWGTKTIVDGVESLVDSFHQLGATWRFIADSIQNFGIFGVETSKSILQLDVNAIDIQTAAKAAANRRALQAATFFGKPKGAQGQLVVSFSTVPEDDSGSNAPVVGVGIFSLLSLLALLARFKWFLI
ncbi:MAG: hypothetical protein ABR507_11665 [Actinomycetota bacterium]